MDLPPIGLAPVQAIRAAPYVPTLVLPAGLVGEATPPKAGGVAYVKGR